MNKNDYINKEEYGSDVQQDESAVEDIKEAGFQTNFDDGEHAHQLTIQREWEDNERYEQRKFHILPNGEVLEDENRGYEHSPINEGEEGMESSPSQQYPGDDDLLKISQEVKKKD